MQICIKNGVIRQWRRGENQSKTRKKREPCCINMADVFAMKQNGCSEARRVRSGTTEKRLVSDGTPRGDFYRKQLLFSFKKRNKQSNYGIGTAGNKVKCDGGHTTVNVWI